MMEANDFIVKLKADNTEKNNYDILKVIDEYKANLTKLPAKDRGLFSLNVLRTLCWNLDKAPLWRDRVDNQALLTLSVDCVRETCVLDRADRVRTLACIYHLHKHAVRLRVPVSPELVLKISFMPFELDSKHLLQEYHKTYWNILVDRLSYTERLKTRVNILKLLPKLTEDVSKVIEIYDTAQFCSTILVFLVKKLHFLYNERHVKELSQTFGKIFTEISKQDDLKLFKKLTEKENLDLYVKLNDCLYVIVENASRVNFKDCRLDGIVQTCVSLVGHSPDLFHCLQTFYQNSFCSILSENTDLTYTETILGSLQQSLETAEKLGYKKAMNATYPYLSQLLRLYIEYNVTNCSLKPQKQHFNLQIQENCLKLILFFMKKLNNCEQLLKCENCHVRSGLHDSIRLSLLIKHFLTISLSQNISITSLLDTFYTITMEQYAILTELNKQGCTNHQKFFRKLQTDIHNTAISLNKAQYFEFSIKLFDVYLKYELKCPEINYKNVSRALFNKSICELDCQLYEHAIIDAFLSLIFSWHDGLNTDKYMSLVMDIKAKELKSKSDDEDVQTDTLQLISVLNACKMSLERKLYGDLMFFMSELKFSVLLKHEFSMYAKLWPSIAPIGGVWRSLLQLSSGELEDWIPVEQEDTVLETLYEVILETASVVRTVHSEHFTAIVKELVDNFDGTSKLTADQQLVRAALLFLQFEYDLAAASQKYSWKVTEPLVSMDPDQVPANRTIPQEHAATKRAIVAVQLLTDLLPNIQQASKTLLHRSLQLYRVFVPLLLHLCRDVQGLQLAYVCCRIAELVGDDESYILNAGALLSLSAPSAALQRVTSRAGRLCAGSGGEPALMFLCDAAMHYIAQGETGAAARLVQVAQTKLLLASELQPEENLELALGRALEAQAALALRCAPAPALSGAAPSALTAVNAPQRHYLATATTGTRWCARRCRSATLRLRTALSAAAAVRLARRLRVRARARAAAAASLPRASAARRAALYADITDVGSYDDAMIKIDNRLKHALGLQPSNEIQPYYAPESTTKQPPFTPKQDIETMLDNMVLKKAQISPSQPCVSVPAFKIPEFLKHSSKCTCYACEIPLTLLLACRTSGLEAAMYSRANENEIARNYFDGVLDMIKITDRKLKEISKKYKYLYEDFVVNSVFGNYESELNECLLNVLIELSFFELKNKNYDLTDEYIVKMHEVVQEMGSVDQYLSNEIMNLMIASAQLKKIIRKPDDIDLDEFESLRLSPLKFSEPPKTPVNKPQKPPKPATKIVVKDEELPKKLKVIKLNLEDDDDKDFEKPTRSLSRGVKKDFKIPNPITTKPVLEIATPRPSRSVPIIIQTQPSEDTPIVLLNTENEFFTPVESTPDQFFTPMTSVKTYPKKSLRQNIVKNLEKEFTTPKTVQSGNRENKMREENPVENKENPVTNKEKLIANKRNTVTKDNSIINKETSTSSRKSKVQKEVKKVLVRAVSPGKLTKENKERDGGVKQRRLRTQVNFSVDENDQRP